MKGPVSYRRIELPKVEDERGRLMFAEEGGHIPFVIKRIFAIFDVKPGASRGGHSHRTQHQFLIMLTGRCRATIDDGNKRSTETLERPTEGLHIPPGLWLDLDAFSPGGVCLVLSSGTYDATDYVRDYREFKHLSGNGGR